MIYNLKQTPEYRMGFIIIMHIIRYANIIGVNISERKSGTERMKKRKKQELVFVAITYSIQLVSVVDRLDATRILPELQ